MEKSYQNLKKLGLSLALAGTLSGCVTTGNFINSNNYNHSSNLPHINQITNDLSSVSSSGLVGLSAVDERCSLYMNNNRGYEAFVTPKEFVNNSANYFESAFTGNNVGLLHEAIDASRNFADRIAPVVDLANNSQFCNEREMANLNDLERIVYYVSHGNVLYDIKDVDRHLQNTEYLFDLRNRKERVHREGLKQISSSDIVFSSNRVGKINENDRLMADMNNRRDREAARSMREELDAYNNLIYSDRFPSKGVAAVRTFLPVVALASGVGPITSLTTQSIFGEALNLDSIRRGPSPWLNENLNEIITEIKNYQMVNASNPLNLTKAIQDTRLNLNNRINANIR